VHAYRGRWPCHPVPACGKQQEARRNTNSTVWHNHYVTFAMNQLGQPYGLKDIPSFTVQDDPSKCRVRLLEVGKSVEVARNDAPQHR
jgi:hypothetical protein